MNNKMVSEIGKFSETIFDWVLYLALPSAIMYEVYSSKYTTEEARGVMPRA